MIRSRRRTAALGGCLLGTVALAAPGMSAAKPVSVYTDVAQSRCQVVKKAAVGEGEWVITRCPGYGPWKVFVDYDDAREQVRLERPGVRLKLSHGVGAFNSVGPRLEWRLPAARAGKPVAVIFRVRWKDVATKRRRSRLVVAKLGPAGGCVIAWVEGYVGAMNRRARHIADTRAGGFVCGRDPTIRVR